MIDQREPLTTHTIEDITEQIEQEYFYSQEAKKNEFLLVKNRSSDFTDYPRKVAYYSLSISLQGRCTKYINGQQTKLSAGSLLYITPQHVTATKNCSPDFKINQLFFTRDFLEESFFPNKVLDELLWIDPNKPPLFKLQQSHFRKAQNLFKKLEEEAKSTQPYYKQILQNGIVEMLYQMNRLDNSCLKKGNEKSTQTNRLFKEFKDLVDKHYKEIKHVSEYANLLHVTPKHLSETVKKESGSTALQHIHQRIIREAKNLLTYTDKSAKEIAYRLGFKTPSHFGRFFKRRVDSSPIQYRKSRKTEH